MLLPVVSMPRRAVAGLVPRTIPAAPMIPPPLRCCWIISSSVGEMSSALVEPATKPALSCSEGESCRCSEPVIICLTEPLTRNWKPVPRPMFRVLAK